MRIILLQLLLHIITTIHALPNPNECPSSDSMSKTTTIYKNAIQPLHGQALRNLLGEETRRQLWNKLDAMPSSDTWYGDIYKKAIYGAQVFRDESLGLQSTIEQHFPGYRILADLYLEKTPQDDGFPFHTDFDSNGFMERPEEMITVWVPLTDVMEEGSGQLSIVTEEGAIRLSLIRVAHQLHSLTCVMDKSVPSHSSFGLTPPEQMYMERTKFTPALAAGDALVFCNAFFHKSEPVLAGAPGLMEGNKRAAYIMRLVPKECRFSKTRLLALQSLGQNLNVVEELLQEHYPEANGAQKQDIHRSNF